MHTDTYLIDMVIKLVHGNKFSLTDEKETQVQLSKIFDDNKIPYAREYSLSKEDIVDFLVNDSIAIEVKIKGQKRAIYRQLVRYATHEKVKNVILLTGVSMGLPSEIEGKPTYFGSLSRGWL